MILTWRSCVLSCLENQQLFETVLAGSFPEHSRDESIQSWLLGPARWADLDRNLLCLALYSHLTPTCLGGRLLKRLTKSQSNRGAEQLRHRQAFKWGFARAGS